MVCPSCGKDNLPGSDFCEDCGAQLNPKADTGRVAVAVRELPLRAGHVLQGRFAVDRLLHEGRYNTYVALDQTNNQAPVAIVEDVGRPSTLTNVAELLKTIRHASLWEVWGGFEENGRSYLMGSPLPDTSLHTLASRQPGSFSERQLQAIFVQVLRALEALHNQGLLHRSILPSNVWIWPDGRVTLLGVERVCSAQPPPADFDVQEGFSPPEAYGIDVGKVDIRSDIYGVGACMYFALAGTVPSLEKREQFFSFPPLSQFQLDVDAMLEEIILKAVSKDPRMRFPTAGVMAQMIEGLQVTAMPVREKPGSSLTPSAPMPPPIVAPDTAPMSVSQATQMSQDGTPALPVPGSDEATAATKVPLTLRIGRGTNVGSVREVNQDSMLVVEWAAAERSIPTKGALMVVADGMGGEAEGDKASSLAIRALAAYVVTQALPVHIGSDTARLHPPGALERIGEMLINGLRDANRTVNAYASKDSTRRGMGSTVTAAIVEGSLLVVGHAGDTRAYLINETVEPITEDHSLVGKLVKMGQMTRDEALHSPQRSLIYRAVGTQEAIDIDVYHRIVKPGDWLLICCDGVWEYFTDAELGSIFKQFDDPQRVVDELIRRCLERGADDNCTAIVAQVMPPAEVPTP